MHLLHLRRRNPGQTRLLRVVQLHQRLVFPPAVTSHGARRHVSDRSAAAGGRVVVQVSALRVIRRDDSQVGVRGKIRKKLTQRPRRIRTRSYVEGAHGGPHVHPAKGPTIRTSVQGIAGRFCQLS